MSKCDCEGSHRYRSDGLGHLFVSRLTAIGSHLTERPGTDDAIHLPTHKPHSIPSICGLCDDDHAYIYMYISISE